MPLPAWYFATLSVIFGLFIGSFLNVVIYRVPRRKSIAFPPSHCPRCKTSIKFYDNIPVLSWLFLRGRCRQCRQPIAFRYPLVELLNAALWLGLALKFGPGWEFARGIVFASVLIVLSFIDLDRQIIPDVISLPALAVGLLSSLLIPGDIVPALRGLVPSLLGAAAGAASIWLLRWFWLKALKKEGLGGGDIPLAGLIGAFLGWKLVLLTIFLGAVIGVIGGVASSALSRKKVFGRPIPFGPFLSLAALVCLFAGEAILRWYWNLFRP